MDIQISLQPAFLRHRLANTRLLLLGQLPAGQLTQLDLKTEPTLTTTTFSQEAKGILSRVLGATTSLLIVLSLLVGLVLFVPQLYYAYFPADTVPVETLEEGSVLGGDFATGASEQQAAQPAEQKYIPPQDSTLPEGKWLIIPRIGVRTQLLETDNPEEALKKGVWKVPGYAEAGDTSQPMILAAHRFGWQWWWQSDYWRYNSFYLLPDTQPGDFIEIIDDQRKWVYEIYAGAEGDEIDGYDADLILYTCKFLNSPVRHFRYARLIDPTIDTQG